MPMQHESVADRWHKEAETWFDGTVDSVDRRLAQCNHLLALAREAVGHDGVGPSSRKHLGAIVDLSASHEALMGLRRDLLTAASDRETAGLPEFLQGAPDDYDPNKKTPGQIEQERRFLHKEVGPPRLSHRDRRYVALESAKFLAANPNLPADELAIRAANHAQLQTSTFTRERSRQVTAAFVDRVAELHQDTPRPRVASRPTSAPACPDEFIYL